MSYELVFHKAALKEWKKLDPDLRAQFRKKLVQRLETPRVPGDRLMGYTDHYKIKLRRSGYRLVYEVRDDKLVIIVIAVGKRERSEVYRKAAGRS